jgi:hypothetical protein
MKLYCDKCFAKSEYKFSKPKFCPECGEKVSSATVSVSANRIVDTKDVEKHSHDEHSPRVSSFRARPAIYSNDTDEDLDEYIDDYAETQRHINNFKRIKNKHGVIVERDDGNKGISFGQLIEGSSNSRNNSEDFKMTDDVTSSVKKTKQQILDEMKSEASSKPRVIDID